MEDTLGEKQCQKHLWDTKCPNPCSNGRYSRRTQFFSTMVNERSCPNPCSNGRYSRRLGGKITPIEYKSLNPCSNGRYSRRVRGVKALFQVGGE